MLDAYQALLDWYLSTYQSDNPERKTRGRSPVLRINGAGSYVLTIPERRRILMDHIYGVDTDPSAVEVTKLSLLLKVLEGESEESLGQGRLAIERALPDLSTNIACGNSLIEKDFFTLTRDPDLLYRVNPFSWADAFSSVFQHGGFDALVGNPPWLMAGYYLPDKALEYIRDRYATAEGKFDLYYTFVEVAQKLLREGGRFGMILPNKMFHTRAARALRGLIGGNRSLERVVDFGIEKVFENTTNYSAIVVASDRAAKVPTLKYERRTRTLALQEEFAVSKAELGEPPWVFVSAEDRELFDQMRSVGVRLDSLVDRFATGVQTGADSILVISTAESRTLGLGTWLVRPFLKGRDVRRWRVDDQSRRVVFPYRIVGGSFKLLSKTELESHPKLLAYLNRNKEALDKSIWFGKTAKELSGAWYGLMYVEDAASFTAPHLLTPALAFSSQFALGNGSLFATGTAGVVGLVLRDDGTDPRYLVGILNSSLLSYYITSHSPSYQGDFRKFSKPYLEHVPIVEQLQASKNGDDEVIINLVDRLTDLAKQDVTRTTEHARTVHRRAIDGAQAELDATVASLYGLSSEQIKWLSSRTSIR